VEHKAYVPNPTALEKLNVQATRNRVLQEHNATVQSLIEFCRTKYGVEWTEQEAEDALLLYLKEHDLEILAAAAEGTPIPPIGRSVRNAVFLVNAFARHLHHSNPSRFKYLETIVKGHLLANTLVFPDLSEVKRNFRRTMIFFDTKFILNALGLCGTHYQAPCKDLLDLLHEAGANLYCFRHTIEEVYGILDACSRALRRADSGDLYGDVGRFLLSHGWTSSDVALAMAKLEKQIGELRIKVREKPAYDSAHQIDEALLDELLEKHITYHNEAARKRDVDSLSAIYRLRQGREYWRLEECAALFVTPNGALVSAAAEFFKDYQLQSTVPIAITDHHLTNIMWLKKPMTAPDLPRKHIIANAYAAMEPPEELWKKYLAEVAKLQAQGTITADDYYLLRSTLDSQSILMELTFGDPDAFAEGTVHEILERVKARIKAEEAAKIQHEKDERKKVEEELRTRDLKISGTARQLAAAVVKVFYVSLMILLVLGTYSTLPGVSDFFATRCSWGTLVLFFSQLVLLTIGLVGLFDGTTVNAMARRTETRLARYTEVKLRKLFT